MKRTISLLLALIALLSLVGCAGSQPADVDLNEILTEMEKQVSLSEMMTLQESDLTDLYGIQPADVEQFYGSMVGDGISPDEIVMIKAKDADAAARVRQALESRLQNKRNEAKGYNPDAYSLMQKSKVSLKGNYVSLLVSSEQDKLTSVYDSFVK